MSESESSSEEFGDPTERTLHVRLEPVRRDPPMAPADLHARVAQTLRWQSIVVLPVTAALAIAGGALDALRTMLPSRES